jgi:hypothetical protein
MPATVKAVMIDTTPTMVTGQSAIAPMPPDYIAPQQIPNIFGQDHYYSVSFRGNGEAVVSLKAILTNNSETPISKIDLRVPKINPTDIFAYQVVKEKYCIGGVREIGVLGDVGEIKNCIQFQEPDYYQMWGQAKYQKATSVYEGDTLSVMLPQPIKPGGSGSYLLYFRGFGFARKNLIGGFDYTFETLKVNDKIRNLTVGISTDSDLILRGQRSNVNYRFEMAPMMADKGMAVPNAQFDSFYQQIGWGQINKTASNLMPLESYSTTGSYADANWKNYWKELVIGLIGLIGLIGIIGLIGKLFAKNNFVLAGMIGFSAAAVISGYTFLLWFLTQNSSYSLGYREMAFSRFNLITGIFLAIISFAIYGLLLFLPGIVLGVKRGWAVGLTAFISTIVFLSLFFTIFILAFGNSQNNYPVPMVKSMDAGSAVQINPGRVPATE